MPCRAALVSTDVQRAVLKRCMQISCYFFISLRLDPGARCKSVHVGLLPPFLTREMIHTYTKRRPFRGLVTCTVVMRSQGGPWGGGVCTRVYRGRTPWSERAERREISETRPTLNKHIFSRRNETKLSLPTLKKNIEVYFIFFGSWVLAVLVWSPLAARLIAGLGPGVDLPERVPLSGASLHQVHGRGLPYGRPGGHHVEGGAEVRQAGMRCGRKKGRTSR